MVKIRPAVLCSLALLAAVWSAHGQDFSLKDALDDFPTEKPKPKPKPPSPPKKTDDFDLSDFFDPATPPPKVVPKVPPRRPDIPMTTRKPRPSTNKPHKKPAAGEFDLSDALDNNNDPKGKDFSDSDLADAFGDGYRPDKGKGGSGGGGGGGKGYGGGGMNEDTDSGNLAETGTIAGIASALAMALIGAVSSYISYQQKKFCFSIQQGLNADYVKGEQMEGVVSEEPQVKYSSLQSQSAAPPSEDPSKV
ncbi:CD99 antigen-like protein 2 isoform X2 [Hyperolius riggenbachi]|uniref:CD99 antigen-like protein 2 isoform X2 n=1 Tax=Hyperolius riggenbachi TaxID=752182 RepID=UPI0035A2D833